MGLRKSPQILAIASLSSPHFDANPFSAASDNVPDFSAFLRHRRALAMAPEPWLWDSAGNSNQIAERSTPAGCVMSARITVNLAANGVLEIWLNEQGRDLLVKELQHLSERRDHFHLGPADTGEVVVSSRPYRPDDTVFEYGKVYLRPDAWDKEYFPHVLNEKA